MFSPIKSPSEVSIEDSIHDRVKCAVKEEEEDEESKKESWQVSPETVIPVNYQRENEYWECAGYIGEHQDEHHHCSSDLRKEDICYKSYLNIDRNNRFRFSV